MNPANAMGASKRLAEMVCQCLRRRVRRRRDSWPCGSATFSTRPAASCRSVPRADRIGGAGHGDRPGDGTILHDHPRGMPAHHGLGVARDTAERCSCSTWARPCGSSIWRRRMIRLAGKIPGEDIAIEFVGSAARARSSPRSCFTPPRRPLRRATRKSSSRAGNPSNTPNSTRGSQRLRHASDAYDEPAMRRILAELVPEYYCSTLPPAGPVRRRSPSLRDRRLYGAKRCGGEYRPAPPQEVICQMP